MRRTLMAAQSASLKHAEPLPVSQHRVPPPQSAGLSQLQLPEAQAAPAAMHVPSPNGEARQQTEAGATHVMAPQLTEDDTAEAKSPARARSAPGDRSCETGRLLP